MKKSYVQIRTPDGPKLVPKDAVTLRQDSKLLVSGDIEPFVSPITGEVIRGRGHLRQHMKEHGVTNSADYSTDWYEKKGKERLLRAQGQDRQSKRERIETIKRAMGVL